MAKNISLIAFAKLHGKAIIRPYNMGGKSWTALLFQDSEGNETFVAPNKDTNTVVNSDGAVLVDFNLPAEKVAEQIKAHKAELVILQGNKNWDSPDEEEIPVYTLVSKLETQEIELGF